MLPLNSLITQGGVHACDDKIKLLSGASRVQMILKLKYVSFKEKSKNKIWMYHLKFSIKVMLWVWE